MIIAAVAVVWLSFASSGAQKTVAHPGGTDGNGCHVCRTNCTERWGIPYGYYHRHNPVRPCFSTPPPILPTPVPRSPYAAFPLSAAQACENGRATVTFSWAQGAFDGDSQWIDLSLFNNGFAGGTFVGVGPMPGFQEVLVWQGLLPGRTHYYRINTFAVGGWHPTDAYSFTTRLC